MSDTPNVLMRLNRRQFASLTASLLAGLGIGWPSASADEASEIEDWQRLLDAILGGKEAVEDKVTLDLPEVAENGNLVPFTVAVDYPVTGTDFIQAIHIIATNNESPPVASFYFTPFSGAARASSRMRLADTADIIALAQTSGGAFYMGRRRVEVVVGCCGG